MSFHFLQEDLESHKIMYTHTSKEDTHEDSFKFTVVNGQNHNRNGIFKILITPVDRILPMLVKNIPLTVVQDESSIITKDHLHILDPDTPPMNLTYIMVESPQYGVLLSQGAVVTQFTQYEVDSGLVRYKNGGSNEAGVDYFLFTITGRNCCTSTIMYRGGHYYYYYYYYVFILSAISPYTTGLKALFNQSD